MNLYLVTYDTDDAARASSLRAHLQTFEETQSGVQVQKSVWLVRSGLLPSDLTAELAVHLHEDHDHLFVTRIRGYLDHHVWGVGQFPNELVSQFIASGGLLITSR